MRERQLSPSPAFSAAWAKVKFRLGLFDTCPCDATTRRMAPV
jgi:hypothetical protein